MISSIPHTATPGTGRPPDTGGCPATPHLTGSELRLRQHGDGWALVTRDGQLVFQAPGLRGRRRCLQYARAEGVLALLR
jgi:hypothetical protein